jgi:cysteine-rich repeat protein
MLCFRWRMSNSVLGMALLPFALVFTPGASLSEELSNANHRLIGGSFSAAAAVGLKVAGGGPGVGAGSAVIAEASPTGAMSDAGGVTLAAGFSAIAAEAALCGNGTLDPGEACDDGGTSPGDGCWVTCEVETGLALEGVAFGGYTIEFTVNGVELSILTNHTESADEIAGRIADEINAGSGGADAIAVGDQVFTNGTVTNALSNDPGISVAGGGGPKVPGLSGWAMVLLVMVLLGVGVRGQGVQLDNQ